MIVVWLIRFFASFVILGLIDFPWIKFVMKPIYEKDLKPDLRKISGQFRPRMVPAVFVYLMIAFGLCILVLPGDLSLASLFFKGATLGLVSYGVFDLTCYSIFANYTLRIVLLDVVWGALLIGLTSCVVGWGEMLILG